MGWDEDPLNLSLAYCLDWRQGRNKVWCEGNEGLRIDRQSCRQSCRPHVTGMTVSWKIVHSLHHNAREAKKMRGRGNWRRNHGMGKEVLVVGLVLSEGGEMDDLTCECSRSAKSL